MVVQFYYVLVLRSLVDKHPKISNSFEIVVALGFYSFCNDISSE